MSLEDMAGGDAQYDDPPAITLGDLRDGEEVQIVPSEPVETFTSQYADDDEENDALRWTSVLEATDYTFRPDDHNGALESGDAVTLISWSNTLAQAILAEAEKPDASDLVGKLVTIQKFGSGYDVTYRLTVDDPAE